MYAIRSYYVRLFLRRYPRGEEIVLDHRQPAIAETALEGFAGDVVKLDLFEFFVRAVKADSQKAVTSRIFKAAVVLVLVDRTLQLVIAAS